MSSQPDVQPSRSMSTELAREKTRRALHDVDKRVEEQLVNQACHAPGGTLRRRNGATMSIVKTATCRLRSSHFWKNGQAP